ncbi:MAG: hypothetical protein JKY67_11170 [Pseudomonadales bacterium]|nr:hypothetical protein [Pseudomonadales bacterium]MBL4866921.1 hypothetical protein [Pseudomonadales bacterium]
MMSDWNTYFALFGCGLAYVATSLAWSRSRHFPAVWRWCIAVAGLVVLIVPFAQEPLLILIRGFTGDFSMGTLLLCSLSIASSLFVGADVDADVGIESVVARPGDDRDRDTDRDRQFMLACAVVCSVVLYPFALGWGPVDTYSWGYGHIGFALGLLVICLTAWQFKYYVTVIWLLLGIIAYQLGIYESNNLWDYLIDPFLALYAISYFIRRLISRLIPKGLSLDGDVET